VEYCQSLGIEYFYPGYFVPGNKHFDYKLRFHQPSLEFYEVSSGRWIPFRNFNGNETPLRIMEEKLQTLVSELQRKGALSYLIHYANFTFEAKSKWNSPLAILVPPTDVHSGEYAIIYDTNKRTYYLFDTTDMDCTDLIFEEGDKMACIQFLNLKDPLAESHNASEITNKILLLKISLER
jgi:arginine-tRNA-protein transferase